MSKPDLRAWEVISSRVVLDSKPWMEVTVQQVRLPDGKVVDIYHQIILPDFIIVFAETTDGQVIVERQYKHGLGRVSLTLPAGGILANEEPLAAAQRELLEETGYRSDDWGTLGSFVVHGNYGCGKAHLFRAKGAIKVADPDSGDLEEMQILLLKIQDLAAAVQSGDVALLSSATAIALATNPLIGHDNRGDC